ncbi:MAG TPA: aromatic ring-hydroxylating dioxygenase subunit alpha [Acidimicrobiales bacterium]|jgi:vanillate O-demethylase monooxygenase subunit|nr:aromatic ring-hydroxylating dioxygenase subunit alpha [Acidimicrobiales bacterium]
MSRLLSNVDPALRKCWHPIARPAEVTEQPQRFLLLGEPWVLYRAQGQIVAFADRCPHRRAPLSLGHCEGGTLQCVYHGWRFDPSGACVEIPALGADATLPPAARLSAPAGLVESHGMVFLAPEEPVAPLGVIPEATDDSFVAGELPTLRARASAGLLADNFLDVAHFPFVHAGTFGADEAAEVPQYGVARDGWSFTMSYEHSFANREDPAVASGTRPLVQTRRLAYCLSAPFHLRLRIDFVEAGGSNVIGFFIQPETAESCRLFTTLWRDDLAGDAARLAQAVDFEVDVLREDLLVQEAFDELVLPLAPTAEVHTRADRTTLELRRVLSDLVTVADGTAP